MMRVIVQSTVGDVIGRYRNWGVIDEGEGVVVVDVRRDVVGEIGGGGSFVEGELSYEKYV